MAVLEKGKVAGAHQLSGAVMNPSAIRELFPDDDSWPHYGEVEGERVYFMLNQEARDPAEARCRRRSATTATTSSRSPSSTAGWPRRPRRRARTSCPRPSAQKLLVEDGVVRRRPHRRQGPRQGGRREGQLRARLRRHRQGDRARRGLLGPPDRRRAEGPRPRGEGPAGVGARRQGGVGGRAAARQGHPHARLAAAPAGQVQGVRRLVDLRHEPRGRGPNASRSASSSGSTGPTRGSRPTTCCRSSSCTRSCARSSRAASAWAGARRRSPRAATGRCPRCTRPAWSICGDAGGMVNVPRAEGHPLRDQVRDARGGDDLPRS